jgi:methyltransferase (TIGR00027 family)
VPVRRVTAMRSPATARFFKASESVFGRGQLLWFGVRKRWVAEAVHSAIADGAEQFLVVGAGFDPLSVLTAKRHSKVLCVEIDAPPTAEPKRHGVNAAGLQEANHIIVASDLSRTPLEEALAQTPWRKDSRTIVVAEGLLMYLAPADVRAFFAAVRKTTGSQSRVAFSTMDLDARGRPSVRQQGSGAFTFNRVLQATLRMIGEPMHWGIKRADMSAFLDENGFRVIDQPTDSQLRERFLDPIALHDEPLAPYEHLTLAEAGPRGNPDPGSYGSTVTIPMAHG